MNAVIVWLDDPLSVLIEKPNEPLLFDRSPDQKIDTRLRRCHRVPYSFVSMFRGRTRMMLWRRPVASENSYELGDLLKIFERVPDCRIGIAA